MQSTTQDSYNFWENVLNGGNFWRIEPNFIIRHKEYGNIAKLFAQFAIEILSIPCSETTCERVFSHLEDLLMNNKRNLTSDLLNSLLIIRMNSLFLKQYGKDSHEFISEELPRLFNEDSLNEDLNYRKNPLIYF